MKLLKCIGLVVMLIALCACAHSASAAPVVSVEPGSIQVTQGDIFTVNIMVSPAGSEIRGAEYKLYFDNTLVSATEQTSGDFLGGVNLVDDINNTIGRIMYGEFKISGVAATAPGILATITFNATDPGVCSLNLDDVILSDSGGNETSGVEIRGGTCKILAAEHTPTATATTTSKPMSPTPVETATAVQTDTDLIPPLPGPHITETESTIPAQTQAHPSEENTPQSGFTSAIAIIGMLVVLSMILRKK
jgi:hypothetical protein